MSLFIDYAKAKVVHANDFTTTAIGILYIRKGVVTFEKFTHRILLLAY